MLCFQYSSDVKTTVTQLLFSERVEVYRHFPSSGKYSCFPCRSLGTAGQLGDAASGRCSPCRDWGLLDDHPAAAVALCRPPAQRTAPCLAPETRGGWFYCLSALCNDLCTGVLMKKVQCTTPEWRLLGCLLVPEDS